LSRVLKDQTKLTAAARRPKNKAMAKGTAGVRKEAPIRAAVARPTQR
jgi:hypothetical protein